MDKIPIATIIEPSAPPINDNMVRFQYVVKKYNISEYFALQLRQLYNYEICIICDDSGSMNNPVNNDYTLYENVETRWSEAQTSLKIITDIASIFDPNGIDIYYLNRPPIKNIFNSDDLYTYHQFLNHPNGFTPLGERIQEVLEEKKSCERNLLIIVFTDGQPNNMNLFMNVLKNRKPIDKIFITIVACTDDDASIGYLNDLDKKIKNLDVCDDYTSEKQQIQKIQGLEFSFTFGDYITKILLGSINQNIDKLDEKKLNKTTKKSNCIIS